MSLIACPECGNSVSAQAPTCPSCGVQIRRESKLVVYAPVQFMLFNPRVKVMWNGHQIALMKKGEKIEVPIDTEARVDFFASAKSASMSVQPGSLIEVQLMWDRMTGGLIVKHL